MPSQHFTHLKDRCENLVKKYLDPVIAAEKAALLAPEPVPLPDPDFDDFAAFRLLTHAELEGYFESKAADALSSLDTFLKSGNNGLTSRLAATTYLYLWKHRIKPEWPEVGDDVESRQRDQAFAKKLAQEALGFGRQFVKQNNGIKEASINVLSALMGFFPDELDKVLVSELNQYGKKRGDVAHGSYIVTGVNFDSAEIEKNRLVTILKLTEEFYEK